MSVISEIVENYIRTKIPLTKIVDIKVVNIDNRGALFTAPLAPNINDKGIGFAGSMETLLTISSWGWVFSLFQNIDPKVKLYIRRCSFEFNAPVTKDLVANVIPPELSIVDKFLKDYRELGKARIEVKASLGENNEAEFLGTFIAIKKLVQ